MTMIEKILASHSNRKEVRAGDFVTCKLDRIVHIDIVFTTDWFAIPNKICDASRHVGVMDHVVPAPTVRDAEGAAKFRAFMRRFGIQDFFDVGRHGIEHQVVAEEGFALPGQLLACEDSHTCGAGAFNCGARGLGALGMTYAACKGEAWYIVGPTIKYEMEGDLPNYAMGHDVFLHMAGMYGEDTNKNAEFAGPGIESMGIDIRQCIATMCANMSYEFATFPCDARLLRYLQGRAVEDFVPVSSDSDAKYEDVRVIRLGEVVPQVALPHSIPNNCVPVETVAGTRIDQAFIGSCAGGRLEDLAIASEIVRQGRVADGVRLIVTPASQRTYLAALRAGYIEALVEAGATVTNSTCGACYGGHMGLLAANERCITSSTRNFKGRMGSPDSEVLIGSPATVAASAVAGCVTDPRVFLGGGR